MGGGTAGGFPDQTPVNKPENPVTAALARVPMVVWLALALAAVWWVTRKK